MGRQLRVSGRGSERLWEPRGPGAQGDPGRSWEILGGGSQEGAGPVGDAASAVCPQPWDLSPHPKCPWLVPCREGGRLKGRARPGGQPSISTNSRIPSEGD